MICWLVATGTALLVAFALSVMFGPPYIPTLTRSLHTALDMLDLRPGQTVLDIGSGDGKVLIAAAERGWNAVGIEINPFLVIISRLRTRRYRGRVRVVWGNYFTVQWPQADAVFGFIIQRHMRRLDQCIRLWHTKPVMLASFAFHIPGKSPVAEKDGVHLYMYK